MKKATTVLILALLVMGCRSSLEKVRSRNRQSLSKLSVGMSEKEAIEVMGKRRGGGRFGEPCVSSPYKREILQGTGKTFEIFYYYTEIKGPFYNANPSKIADDELTPLVFDDGILIGWGNSFLRSNAAKFGIKVD